MIKKIILLLIPCLSFGEILDEKDKIVSEQDIEIHSFESGKLEEPTELNLMDKVLYEKDKTVSEQDIEIHSSKSEKLKKPTELNLMGKVLYEKDKTVSEQDIEIHSFGSGKLKESTELNSKCLRLESNNFYSGGKILFSKPIYIKELWEKRNLLLTFDFIQGGSGLLIHKKNLQINGSRRKFELKISVLQPDNQGGEICFPIEIGTTQIGFSLNSVKKISPTQPIVGLKISTSSDECLFLTRIHFNQDTTPVKGKILSNEQQVGLGEEIKFKAEGSGGATPLQFHWAINPKSIFQIDGKEAEWSYRFLKPGPHYIRLIISDIFGFKKPYITFKKVIVNP